MNEECLNAILNNKLKGSKLEIHKDEIKQYCISEYNKELLEAEKVKDTLNSREYIKEPLYEFASHLISAMSWNYYNSEYNGKYQGRRMICNDCSHCENAGCQHACNCNLLDSRIKIFKKNDICSNFDEKIKVSYDTNKYSSLENYLKETGKLEKITFTQWKTEKLEYCTFKDYIHYLNNEYYIDWKGGSTLYLKHNTIYIDNKTLHIPIDARWFKLDFIKDGNIYCKKITIPTKKRHTPYEVIGTNINYNIMLKESYN